MHHAQSPYEATLGDAITRLHPRLRSYFSAVPEGGVGVGEGVFTTVGTPRRWLYPFIRLFAGPDVMFPIWEKNVPFTVHNSAVAPNHGAAVAAQRTFHLSSGDRVMHDLIVATPTGLVDLLGRRRRFCVRLDAEVVAGELWMSSRRVELRIGNRHIRFPAPIAPRVTLSERFSDADDRQHVAVSISVPLIGKVYEYEGSFRYEIRLGN